MKPIWLLTFESYMVRKVGGLAEVPPRLAKALREKGYEATVFTPSHGVKLVDRAEEVYSVNIRGENYRILKYRINPEHFVIEGGVFDDENVYSGGMLLEKSAVFGRVVGGYLKHIVESGSGEAPSVIHGNDWHSYPALLLSNALRVEKELRIKLVYQLHLLSKMKLDLDFFTFSLNIGPDTPVSGIEGVKPFEYYFNKAGGWVEKLAYFTVDHYLTVSNGYLKDVEKNLGWEVAGRINYIPNALVWTSREVFDTVAETYMVKNPLDPGERERVRRRVLTEDMARFKGVITEPHVRESLKTLLEHYELDSPRPFHDDGELVFLSGRLAGQKGLDILLGSLEHIIVEKPRVRVVLAYIPVEGCEPLVRKLGEYHWAYNENLRIIIGKISLKDYMSLYFAADAYIVPSRYEPFGLVAVESLAAGTPVVASSTGGLKDIVVDLRENPEEGVGFLIRPGSRVELAETTVKLLEIMRHPVTQEKVRSNCVKRAREFSWEKSAEKALKIYFS
ncbi:glycosyltransferase [Thermosphaera sp.]